MSPTLTSPAPPAELSTLPSPPPADAPVAGELVVEESLVEEVSIDGMCGVY